MSVNLTDELAEAALRAASKAGYVSLVKALLESGAKANGAAILLADFYGHVEVSKLLRKVVPEEQILSTNPSLEPSP